MKGEAWVFTKFIPDMEDLDARNNSMKAFFNLPEIPMNEGQREVHIFCAAFLRGMKWAIDKYNLEKK